MATIVLFKDVAIRLHPVAYLYCGGDDLAVILLQIFSASDERIREMKLAINKPSKKSACPRCAVNMYGSCEYC
jgi:hypothetical protein